MLKKTQSLASMLRVNYAGELAAVNMYKGQATVLKGKHLDLIKVFKGTDSRKCSHMKKSI